jgi:hypothetical protein
LDIFFEYQKIFICKLTTNYSDYFVIKTHFLCLIFLMAYQSSLLSMLFVVHPKKIKIRRFRERHILELRAEDVRLVIRSRTTVARPLARVQSSKARDAGSTPSQTC